MRAAMKSDLTGRARLREAALELFAERGFEATSTRAVAAAAGLSPALVTRHFGSKQGLREAVDAHVLERIGRELKALEPDTDGLLAALGAVSARLFGADPVLRGYLRHALTEESAASTELFRRLIDGARAELARLSAVHAPDGRRRAHDGPDEEWAPFQMLCLILGPLLLEPVMQPQLDEPMFAPDTLARRSAANQRLLMQGFYGRLQEASGG